MRHSSPQQAFAFRETLLFVLLVAAVSVGRSADAQTAGDKHSYFFMGRVQYSKNDGRDCSGVGRNMARLVSEVSSIHIRDEKKVALTSPDLFETPFLFMNGHNDFKFTQEEIDNLRVYLEHGGFLFVSGCCTNPAFPQAFRREIARVFARPLERLQYDHPIYESFYKVGEIRSLHRNTTVYLEGLLVDDRLVAILCEDGLCCAFSADNSCNVGRGIRPEQGKQLALNIAVYAMTH